MKKLLLLSAAVVILAASCAGQDNTFYVKTFPGMTVGQKVAAAQAACIPDAGVPCVLVIDPTLARYAAGSLPSLNANVTLEDMRAGGFVTNGGVVKWHKQNSVVFVDQEAGATVDAQFAACVAELPNGGTCDARGYGATTQTITSTVLLGGSRLPFTFVFDPSTVFVPGSAGLTMFLLLPGASTSGVIYANTAALSGFSGNVVAWMNNTYSNQATFQSNDAQPTNFGGVTCAGQGLSTGTCVYLQARNGATEWIEFQKFGPINVSGMQYGVHAYATTNGYINSNHFAHIMCSNTVHCTTLETTYTNGSSFGNIIGNRFDLVLPEGYNGYSAIAVNGVWLHGTGAEAGNLITEIAADWGGGACPTCTYTYQIDNTLMAGGYSSGNRVDGILCNPSQVSDAAGLTLIADFSGCAAAQMAGPWVYAGSLTAGYFNSTGSNNYRVNGNAVLANDGTSTYVPASGGSVYLQTAGGNAVLDASGNFSIPTAGNFTNPKIKSTTGVRYVCVDTTGKLVSQATACSGT
jgi:hypothetical protein